MLSPASSWGKQMWLRQGCSVLCKLETAICWLASYISTLLLAGGNLADIDGIRRPVAVGLNLDGLGISRRAGTGVRIKDLLDLGGGEIGKFQV